MITNDSPAQIGETVTFFATGLGLLADYPSNVSVTLDTSEGMLIPASYFMRVTAIFADGHESLGSGENLITVSTGNTNEIEMTWDATPGAVKYRVYVGGSSLQYDRYYETTTNSFNIVSIYGTSGTPPVQTNVPGDGQIHVATTIDVKVAGNDCPIAFSGPNPGVVGVWRISCTIASTLTPADINLGTTDTIGAAEVDTIVGAIDSNHAYLSIRRPPPTTFTATPAILDFAAVAGQGNPPSQPLSVNKLGGGTLTWSAAISTSDGGSWLTSDITSGTNSGTMNISVDQTSLTMGTYTGTITVTGSDANGNPLLDANGNQLTMTTTVRFVISSSSVRPARPVRPRR
jgi:hypothetical protein